MASYYDVVHQQEIAAMRRRNGHAKMTTTRGYKGSESKTISTSFSVKGRQAVALVKLLGLSSGEILERARRLVDKAELAFGLEHLQGDLVLDSPQDAGGFVRP